MTNLTILLRKKETSDGCINYFAVEGKNCR